MCYVLVVACCRLLLFVDWCLLVLFSGSVVGCLLRSVSSLLIDYCFLLLFVGCLLLVYCWLFVARCVGCCWLFVVVVVRRCGLL